jgi:hypothetical protein
MRALLLTGLLAAVVTTAAAATAQTLTAEGAEPGQKIQIRNLTRDSSGALTLRFLLINDSCCGVSGVMLREKGSDSADHASGVVLTDETGAQYRPARGPDGQCLCSIMPNTGRGERANIWVKFAAMPSEARKVTVEVKTFEPIPDVPITGP